MQEIFLNHFYCELGNYVININKIYQLSIENECNKCGNGICKNRNCGWLFPHKYNSMYAICDGCYKSIENKLINYNHLIIYKFLKKNVRRRRISC